MSVRPGLAKIRSVPTLRTKRLLLVATTEWHIREWLETADIVSEGNADGSGSYFGSTSIVLARSVLPEHRDLASALASDPHLKLRALRVAVREARSRGAHGVVIAELSVKHEAKGIVVTIDVEAKSARGDASSPLTRERSC